jgi:hypothetical protein
MLEFLLSDDGLIPPLQRVPNKPTPKPDTRQEIRAAANTAALLASLGDNTTVSEESANLARELFSSGREPTAYERTLPEVMTHLNALLTEYDYSLLEDARKIRNYVANRLLEESNNKDPRIRMRAYELLGKITEVGLFTERSEITVKHKPTEELETLLREKLNKLSSSVIEHAPVVPTLLPEDL